MDRLSPSRLLAVLAVGMLSASIGCTAPVEMPAGDPSTGPGGGKADTAGFGWRIQFTAPVDGRSAYVFPEDLEDGMTWQTTFEVLTADEENEVLVVETQILAFDVSGPSERVAITVDDPIGRDLAFDWGFQYRNDYTEQFHYIGWPLHGFVSIALEDGFVERCSHLGTSDLTSIAYGTDCGTHDAWRFTELSPDARRYFVAPHVFSSGLFTELEGVYETTVRISCAGGPCASASQLDEGLESQPGFCEEGIEVPGRCAGR